MRYLLLLLLLPVVNACAGFYKEAAVPTTQRASIQGFRQKFLTAFVDKIDGKTIQYIGKGKQHQYEIPVAPGHHQMDILLHFDHSSYSRCPCEHEISVEMEFLALHQYQIHVERGTHQISLWISEKSSEQNVIKRIDIQKSQFQMYEPPQFDVFPELSED